MRLSAGKTGLLAEPVRTDSRLGGMAAKNAILLLPEGVESFAAGDTVEVLSLTR